MAYKDLLPNSLSLSFTIYTPVENGEVNFGIYIENDKGSWSFCTYVIALFTSISPLTINWILEEQKSNFYCVHLLSYQGLLITAAHRN